MKKAIESACAPAAIGPYSQAVMNDGLIFVSGQLPIDPKTGEFPSDDIAAQTDPNGVAGMFNVNAFFL